MIGRSALGLCVLLLAAALSPSLAEAQQGPADAPLPEVAASTTPEPALTRQIWPERFNRITLCECRPARPGQAPALIVVNGERFDPAALPQREINPLEIESIGILKGAEAIERYGEDARDGAVLITTKPGAAGLRPVPSDASQQSRCGSART